MAGSLDSNVFLVLGIAAALYFLAERFLSIKLDPKEPPLIAPKIPFIGHILGLIQYGTGYYTRLCAKHPLPIYTLPMATGRSYVVASPELVTAVQRNSKTLAFAPFVLKASSRMTRTSEEGNIEVAKNVMGEEGEHSLYRDTHKGMYMALAPGKDLDALNEDMIKGVSRLMNELDGPGGKEIDLFAWSQHIIGQASTDAVYGPKNPYTQSPGFEQDFWTWEINITAMLLNLAPSITSPQGHKARERMTAALTEYLRQDGHLQGSALIKVRQFNNRKYGVSLEDAARWEIAVHLAVVVNTTPSTFWIITHIFSDPSLLAAVREEVATVVTVDHSPGSHPTRRIDASKMKEICPLLVSIYQEVLRLHSFGVSSRLVLQDTLLDDKYLLKKDAVIQMPSGVLHADSTIWGPNVKHFDPRRFMKPDGKKGEPKKVGCFRAFGGGNSLCPGRHFATTEILSIVAMFVMRYDVVPAEGRWNVPTKHVNSIATSVQQPDRDIKVRVCKRKGYEDTQWEYVFSESNARFALAV